MNKYEKIFEGLDYSEYTRNKAGTKLITASCDSETDAIECSLCGLSEIPLFLYVFIDKGDWVEHRYQEVPPFKGSVKVQFEQMAKHSLYHTHPC